MKSIALIYVGEPMIRARGPHRKIYDERRARMEEMHPLHLKSGEGCPTCDEALQKNAAAGKKKWECAMLGGPHWWKAHLHADARRVMTKAIIADVWAVENGREPRLGQAAIETQADYTQAEAH